MKNNLATPVAIILAGIIIAVALYFALTNKNTQDTSQQVMQEQESVNTDSVNPVTDKDHIKGSPDAPVKLIEYSDFECPFCKRFHVTMNEIMNDPKYKGKVAWVYRQFPLDSLHPRLARKAALASECAKEQGGNDAFWRYADKYMELTPSNEQAPDSFIYDVAAKAGLDADKIKACVESAKYAKDIEEDLQNAIETGGRGTPWSIVITKSGKTIPVNGALPKEAIDQILDFALKN